MFFAKLVASLALVAPLVSALTIETPTDWTSGDPASLTWTAAAGDTQSFSVELINEQFNRQFALANNVPTGQLTINFTLPIVPVGSGYTIQFVNIGNLSDVFAESGAFSIGATLSTSTTSTSTSSVSGSSTVSATLTSESSTSGFGTTRSATATSAAGTGTDSSTSSAAAGSSTTFNSGAVALGISNTNLASFGVMVVAALAGARFVGF